MLRHPHPHLLVNAGRRFLYRRRPDGFTLLLAGLGVLGAALVLAGEVSYGVGLNGDSVNYISVARSLLAGNGFTEFTGDVYHEWPPLYPLLLAGGSLGIFDPLTAAGPLNAGLFGLIIFVVGMYLRTRVESRLLTLWCCLAAALAWPLLDVARFAWSETAAILFSMLALMQSERLLSRGGGGEFWAALGRRIHRPGRPDPVCRDRAAGSGGMRYGAPKRRCAVGKGPAHRRLWGGWAGAAGAVAAA